jgi:RNA polymerase sigma-70 factor (ECF subfamily)
MADMTVILERLTHGDAGAAAELVPLVYEELRQRARRHLDHQPDGHTLQPTALVHEAFLKIFSGQPVAWETSRHFYNAAAEVMRQILVDHARRRSARKRGGGRARVELDEQPTAAVPGADVDWEALDHALNDLRQLDERRYQVVMLRYFAGLTDAQVAASLGLSEKTVERDWRTAKAFLRGRLEELGVVMSP